MLRSVVGLKHMTQLHFHWKQRHGFWQDIFKALMSVVKNLTRLQDLAVHGPIVDSDTMGVFTMALMGTHRKSKRLAGALRNLTVLECLHLENLPLTSRGARALADSTSQLSALKAVKLRCCLLEQADPAPQLDDLIRSSLPDHAELEVTYFPVREPAHSPCQKLEHISF